MQSQRGTGLMTSPLMIFLSVEPFQVRQEILIQAAAVSHYMHLEKKNPSTLPIESQKQIKKEIQEAIIEKNVAYINSVQVQPTEIITNFITLGRGGVATRQTPIEEDMNDAIIGITFVYDIDAFPDSILIDWQMFPDSVRTIEASTVDPHGAFASTLTPEKHTIFWKSRIAGYQAPVLKPIEIHESSKPLFTLVLWLTILGFFIYNNVYKRSNNVDRWLIAALIISFMAYPFLRTTTGILIIPHTQPSKEKAEIILGDLLSNVYSAFDRKDENVVYDLLALSVTNEQLTEIYIQNRQSMAMENRGGARANVDEVNILEIFDIKSGKDGGYVADTQWTVRGSVNHFGHTHYRQNQYRAYVSFLADDHRWKISDIEILNSERLY
jgi:hypothetical protein